MDAARSAAEGPTSAITPSETNGSAATSGPGCGAAQALNISLEEWHTQQRGRAIWPTSNGRCRAVLIEQARKANHEGLGAWKIREQTGRRSQGAQLHPDRRAGVTLCAQWRMSGLYAVRWVSSQ